MFGKSSTMKSPLKKFRVFSLKTGEGKEKRNLQSVSHGDELAQATRDMQDMRNCYDCLLAAAAATANSAFEFSESLKELGSCLLEKAALYDDEDSGRVLLMLGKAQYQIQKFVDRYRAHIFQTITSPSESFLSELQTVEEMKQQCDEKRDVYECLLASQREKGRSRNAKGDGVTSQQVQASLEEYEDEASLFVFRLKSLKQGQSRSLLTQAVRHHSAQMNFFNKGFKFLETVEPHVKSITEQQQIDYQFSGLEDDYTEDGEDEGYDMNDDGQSSDFESSHQGNDTAVALQQSMELDQVNPATTTLPAETEQEKTQQGVKLPTRVSKYDSHSAPILAISEKKYDVAEYSINLRAGAVKKFNTYVLPTPADAKNMLSAGSNKLPARHSSVDGNLNYLWHSQPLETKKQPGELRLEQLSGAPSLSKRDSVLKENNMNSVGTPLPQLPIEGISHKFDVRTADNKKIKRQAFSGPLTSKTWSNKPSQSAATAAGSEHSFFVPGIFARVPVSQRAVSSKVSPSNSPPLMSSPRINELHELPRPPGRSLKTEVASTHSAPLGSRNSQRPLPALRTTPAAPSPLPPPPSTMSRSHSIPSRSGHKAQSAAYLEFSKTVDLNVEIVSPPLTPIAFPSSQPEKALMEQIARTEGGE